MNSLLLVTALFLALTTSVSQAQQKKHSDTLRPIVAMLAENNDPQFQLDVLKGLSDGLKGRRGVPMPAGWEAVASKLAASPNPQVRELAQSLSVTFGSPAAFKALRATLVDSATGTSARSNALFSLLAAKDPQLPSALQRLLNDPVLRGPALRGLAAYDDAKTPAAIMDAYDQLTAEEKRDALATLSARGSYARALLSAVEQKKIGTRELTADLVRQLRSLKDPALTEQVTKIWGVTRDSDADKLAAIERYKRLIKTKGYGDPRRGRAIYSRTCQQCHTLYGEGGKVGPDLTGSARADLDYSLQNVVDPNAVIPNDYRSWNLETKDDRSISGIVTRQDGTSVTIITANETIVVPRNEIASLRQTELSMMPEGMLQALHDDEVRDLLAYLKTTSQVPLP